MRSPRTSRIAPPPAVPGLVSLLASLALCAVLAAYAAPAALADDFDWRELFYEDFAGDLPRWDLTTGWSATEGVLAGSGPASAQLLYPAPWRNHRLMLRFLLTQGDLSLRLRAGAGESYVLQLGTAQVRLLREASSASGRRSRPRTSPWKPDSGTT